MKLKFYGFEVPVSVVVFLYAYVLLNCHCQPIAYTIKNNLGVLILRFLAFLSLPADAKCLKELPTWKKQTILLHFGITQVVP